jgi:dihydropteroate synthase
MGVLNVTPDSFSGDGIYRQPDKVVSRALEMVAEGADILDVGGESTRPGYSNIPVGEEIDRVIPILEALRRVTDVPISIDTTKSEVARQALDAGASIINDVSGLADRRLARSVADAGATLVVTDALRRPPDVDVVADVVRNLGDRAYLAQSEGVSPEHLILDPGFGFGKGWRENFSIIRALPALRVLRKPILVGPSRKGMIGRVLAVPVGDRVEGTIALIAMCIAGGADIVRAHDVQAVTRAARMMDAIVRDGV